MNSSVREFLEKNGLNPRHYVVIRATCDNIKLIHKHSRKVLDIRW